MRVICAPDSFKESLSARDAAGAMACGVRAAWPDAVVDECPVADGGEGTVDALVAATEGELRHTHVLGPRIEDRLARLARNLLIREKIKAVWGILGDGETAVIEMAAASGLALLPPDRRDPTRTTTFGTGELIAAALDAGAKRIILGIGGSATCDGGCGAAQALGIRFFDLDGYEIQAPFTGNDLLNVARIDVSQRDPRLAQAELCVACDVTNPLTGPDGAAYVYGPQKGATPDMVAQLDAGLANVARVWREQLGVDVETMPGAGAAGGMGGGAVAMLGGELRRGIDLVLEAVRFDQRVRDCDLCLTGEGRLDGQTASGKTVAGVAASAGRHGVPVMALAGCLGPGVERVRELGVRRYAAIGEGLPPEESIARAAELLEIAVARMMRTLKRK